MTPEYIQRMADLFDREAQRSEDEFTLIDELTAIDAPKTALSPSAKARAVRYDGALPDLQTEALRWERANLPKERHTRSFGATDRPITMAASAILIKRLEAVAQLCKELAPGSTITSVKSSRFGNTSTRRNTLYPLYIRNLLNILRANSAQAAWEMEYGAISRWLKDFEARNSARNKNSTHGQLESFEDCSLEDAPTPKCESLTKMLESRPLRVVDRFGPSRLRSDPRTKRSCGLLAERTDTLANFC